jgi:MinD-like ATPase involved in chromosome partitioning or flagellar assembly
MRSVVVTVVGSTMRRDLSLPADSPLSELLPTLVRLLGESNEKDAFDPGTWVVSLSSAADDPLTPVGTLAQANVVDGSILYITRSRPAVSLEMAPPSPTATSDGMTPMDRTAALLPPRYGPLRRTGSALRALFSPRDASAQGSDAPQPPIRTGPFDPPPPPAALTAMPRTGPLERFRQAWRSTDYLERLDHAIMEPRLRRCVTIAVVSPKGGVGKTTITALVGMLFAQLRRDRVVAVDANPDYGSLGRVLVPDHSVYVDDFLGRMDEPGLSLTALDTQLGRGPHGLMVLPAPTEPDRMWRLEEDAYTRVIERLQELVGIVLLDCGTGLQEPAAGAAIKAADQLILVSDSEPAAASLVAEAGSLLARAGRPIALVVNKMPTRGSLLELDRFARSLPEASSMVVIPSEIMAAHRLAAAQFDWRTAPEGWRRSIRELALCLVADWPNLGLTMRPPQGATPPA